MKRLFSCILLASMAVGTRSAPAVPRTAAALSMQVPDGWRFARMGPMLAGVIDRRHGAIVEVQVMATFSMSRSQIIALEREAVSDLGGRVIAPTRHLSGSRAVGFRYATMFRGVGMEGATIVEPSETAVDLPADVPGRTVRADKVYLIIDGWWPVRCADEIIPKYIAVARSAELR